MKNNGLSLETEIALLKQGKINTEAILIDMKNTLVRLETKIDNLFLHLDNKFTTQSLHLDSKFTTQFWALTVLSASGFSILGGLLGHVAHWF